MAGQGILKNTALVNFLIEEDDRILGMVTRRVVLSNLKYGRKADALRIAARKDYLVVTEKTTDLRIFRKIFSHEISFVAVLSDGNTASAKNSRGLITKERLAEFITEAAEQFSP